ncbi:ATP-binding cassette domain-containing protein [Aetokthonos hydrillicola Thurmond2011]|jgi:ABC-type multidrug transport system ATPase subunit/ABC-type multidrug transport system permease subunit|uniref:ATP-binding cassette domain-containing protein n=1 Tax=Aetokthonos hydrillicola Thurmond2011 TaxID=2712845 RepID=A0AAP5MD35_9CYAN|nr:ATP-binding cassette domain-containing protein [Aetokthonos hydrillicola]MBO3457916.1 ATP-binding cassette domain-containing protein [Aetokthonos hydrillicola CCALA 1050]MBW4587403.1 ATP-binding cassette domain-containing protein [Aetokthonos hydrillicola CCALA 1050]MDR9899972.1 ATP-binding cassette domain-containing protein [Aetokthonos hydrillicola Thurmond2011]
MKNRFEEETHVNPQTFLLLNNQGQILQIPLDKQEHRLGRDHSWADLQIDTGWEVVSRRQLILKQEGDDYRIYDGDGLKPSSNGIFINQTRINCHEGCLLRNGMHLEIGQNPHGRVLLAYYNPSKSGQGQVVMPSKRRLALKDLKEWPVQLGRALKANQYSSMELEAPTVSRLHATIYPDSHGGHILHDLSTNGTFVDGKRILKRFPLREGSTIQIGPFSLLYHREYLELLNNGSRIRLDVHKLLRRVKDKTGREKVILNDVSLVIEPGQLVALVGGSGAGKSTLMKSLLGIEPVSSGSVFLNGDNLRQNWAVYRSQIGYVPQDDIVHPDLTVEEVLSYACKLRLPPDTDVKQVVETTLEQIKLSHVKTNFIRNLSGGQRKRVSIGVELLADPKLFFLDEPTSGLDPGLDKEMMKLLRELADQGRTVVLVTHATANIEVCDRITFMGRGGKLCYFGPPQQALNFFEMPSTDLKYFSDIYIKLDQGTTPDEVRVNVDNWSQKYLASLEYKTYVKSLLSPGNQNNSNATDKLHTGISPFKQLWLLSQRAFQLALRDRSSLIFSLVSGPIAIALTAWILHDQTPLKKLNPLELSQNPLALKVLFIFSCIGIWIGLSSSVGEIVKESGIYARERLINLGLFSYLGSKILIRSGLTILQTALIVVTILIGFKSPEYNLIPWFLGLGITSFLTLLASISLSLMISAFVKTENEGNSILPLIMIPQIILSGVLFELKGLPGKLGWVTISRWSMGAYGTLVNVNAMVPKTTPTPGLPPLDKLVTTSSVYEPTWRNLGLNWGILGLQTLIFLGVTLWLQKRKDIV